MSTAQSSAVNFNKFNVHAVCNVAGSSSEEHNNNNNNNNNNNKFDLSGESTTPGPIAKIVQTK
jgi:hypothetical protein